MRKALCWMVAAVAMLVWVPREAISANVCFGIGAVGTAPTDILFIDLEGATATPFFNLNGQHLCNQGNGCSPLNGDAFSFTDSKSNKQFIHFGTITHGGLVCPVTTIEGILDATTLSGSGTLWNHMAGGDATAVSIAPIACPAVPSTCAPTARPKQ